MKIEKIFRNTKHYLYLMAFGVFAIAYSYIRIMEGDSLGDIRDSQTKNYKVSPVKLRGYDKNGDGVLDTSELEEFVRGHGLIWEEESH